MKKSALYLQKKSPIYSVCILKGLIYIYKEGRKEAYKLFSLIFFCQNQNTSKSTNKFFISFVARPNRSIFQQQADECGSSFAKKETLHQYLMQII